MTMQIPKLKSFFNLRNSVCPSYYYFYQDVYFHSTPPSLAKWKNKWNYADAGKGQQPAKSYVRYTVRQKRADAKKALKDLLFNSGCSELPSFQDVGPMWDTDPISAPGAGEADSAHGSNKKFRSKKSRRSLRSGKGKPRRESFSADFDEQPGTVFQATFGNRCFTWSYRSWEEPSFQSSSPEFEWRDQSNWTRNRRRVWDSSSETDDDGDVKSCIVGSYSDRTILGLPPTGPLKIEDVKSAFRSSALKWHPDKHQGPLQAEAEEKFKQCVDAYKGLCNALSSP